MLGTYSMGNVWSTFNLPQKCLTWKRNADFDFTLRANAPSRWFRFKMSVYMSPFKSVLLSTPQLWLLKVSKKQAWGHGGIYYPDSATPFKHQPLICQAIAVVWSHYRGPYPKVEMRQHKVMSIKLTYYEWGLLQISQCFHWMLDRSLRLQATL